jgi:hypothetical protein
MAKAHFVPLITALPPHPDAGGIADLDPDRAQRQKRNGQMPGHSSSNGYLATDARGWRVRKSPGKVGGEDLKREVSRTRTRRQRAARRGDGDSEFL